MRRHAWPRNKAVENVGRDNREVYNEFLSPFSSRVEKFLRWSVEIIISILFGFFELKLIDRSIQSICFI